VRATGSKNSRHIHGGRVPRKGSFATLTGSDIALLYLDRLEMPPALLPPAFSRQVHIIDVDDHAPS
jgi:hypothetical protein